MKKSIKFLAGLLMIAVCIFDITTVKRFIINIAGGDTDYIISLVIELIYILGIFCCGLLFILGKTGKKAAVPIAVSSGVALYRTVAYLAGIAGNSMLLPLVMGKMIEISEIIFYALPAAITLISAEKLTAKSVRGLLIAECAALVIGVGGRVVYFLGYGKNFVTDFLLFFETYLTNLFFSAVCFAAFTLAVLCLAPQNIKKRR